MSQQEQANADAVAAEGNKQVSEMLQIEVKKMEMQQNQMLAQIESAKAAQVAEGNRYKTDNDDLARMIEELAMEIRNRPPPPPPQVVVVYSGGGGCCIQ